MHSKYEYRFVSTYIDSTLPNNSNEAESRLNKTLAEIIDDAESSGLEAMFEIVSHSLVNLPDGILLTCLVKLEAIG